MSPDPNGLLDVAQAAAAAGAAVLSTRGGDSLADGAVSNKGEAGDWVTAFDVAAENAVRSAIRAARPQDTITGEEHGTTRPENPSGLRWSIDPLDGTTNFIRNIVYYATSVAVADADGVWLAGVVNAPALGRVYYASRGHGAWLEQGGVMEGFADVRRLGSAALDLCLVADGTHDAFGERGLNEHDFAAGALIAEEAGCWVRRPRLTSPLSGGPSDDERLAAWTCAGTLEMSGKFPL
jgi:myo-inositol-1(or 4)-monophosphatase